MTDHHTPQTQDHNKLPNLDARSIARGRGDTFPVYPNREPMFIAHFIRFLIDSGVVNELGPDAFALLVAVAIREDAIRYQRPPNFYNAQLAKDCGIGSLPALIRARNRAVSLGLLEYKPGAKRRPGTYFVTGFPNESLPKAKRIRKDSERNPEGKRKENDTLHSLSCPKPKPNSSSSVTRAPEPPTGGDDDDEGSLAGCTSEPSGWTPEREAEVRDAIRAAGVYLWEESIKHAKSQGSEPDAVMDALFIAMNHRNPQTNELILDAKGFVTWARTSVFPCDNPPTAAELRKRIAEEESRKRAPKVSPDDARMERRLRREVFEEFKSEGVPYPSDDQIEDRMKALKSGRKSSTASTTPGQVDPRPRRHVRETTAPQTPGQAFDDHPQRGRAAPTRPQQNQTEKPLGVGDPAPVR
jgi:hypothetical protein